jgi:hypothetical protein
MISSHVDKFHDFLTLFVFYTILKQIDHKFTIMIREHGVRKFWYVSKIVCNTTGFAGFAECPKHSAKPQKHSAKPLPSVALGK